MAKKEVSFPKRVAVLSLTGNVGKSTLVNTLLYPRMPGAKIFRVETINATAASGSEEIRVRGDQLDRLKVGMTKAETSIVDVGSSNVESFILGLNEDWGSHQFFDLFLVPVLALDQEKETEDAIKTILALHDMGVESSRIKTVFNKLPLRSSIEEECSTFLQFHKENPLFACTPRPLCQTSCRL